MERWLSGRRRPPGKRVHWATGVEGSNPSLSAIRLIRAKVFDLGFLFCYNCFSRTRWGGSGSL